MRTMFSFKSFLVIIFFCQFVTSRKFLVITNYGWNGNKITRYLFGTQSNHLLKSTKEQDEFVGVNSIKLHRHENNWVFEDDEEKYLYPTSESVSLPLGESTWLRPDSASLLLDIKELQCGKNQGYLIKNGFSFPATDTTSENCFRQVS